MTALPTVSQSESVSVLHPSVSRRNNDVRRAPAVAPHDTAKTLRLR